jgi:acyl carrier protein
LSELLVSFASKFDVDPGSIDRDTLLVQDLDADSLDLLEIVVDLRDRFDINVQDGEVKALLAELARFLPDEDLGKEELDDGELALVTQQLRIGTFVDFIDARLRVTP